LKVVPPIIFVVVTMFWLKQKQCGCCDVSLEDELRRDEEEGEEDSCYEGWMRRWCEEES
jgi:hypothetical protein